MAKKFSLEWWAEQRPEVIGKETEKLVEGILKAMNEKIAFAYHRLPDAKSARGALAAQPADFMWRRASNGGFLEVKALKHAFRLPAARLTQHAVLNKWTWAGADNFVLVHHYMTGKWRIADVRELGLGMTSWDLRNLEEFDSAEMALKSTGCF